jgi:hypothetical protein
MAWIERRADLLAWFYAGASRARGPGIRERASLGFRCIREAQSRDRPPKPSDLALALSVVMPKLVDPVLDFPEKPQRFEPPRVSGLGEPADDSSDLGDRRA